MQSNSKIKMNCFTPQLKGKKVLLFAPFYFCYHQKIKSELEKCGAEVHLYDERNNPSSLKKILIRKAKFLLKKDIFRYYESICEKEKEFHADFVFFVNPEAATEECVLLLKKCFPEGVFILYLWDSLKNKKEKTILHLFDRTYSFDPNDCEKYNMTFRPLFFLSEFQNSNPSLPEEKMKYDFCFIGTLHSNRSKILYEIMKFCDEHQLKYYYYIYIPGKLMLFLRNCVDMYLRKFSKSLVHTVPISTTEFASISAMSRCVIDINHPKQTGLTMRTIEMLGLNKKILTTNALISNYDFYRPENQIVFDQKNFRQIIDDLKKDYCAIPETIYQKYSIAGWINEIFGA